MKCLMHDAVIPIDESERAELLKNAQQRNYMELPNLTTDRKYVGELLLFCIHRSRRQ